MKTQHLQKMCLAALGTLVLTLSAKISILFWPVNATLQSLAVILLGAVYGRKLGAATVGLYVLEGALGFAVFTSTPERGIGLPYMVGPSGGFLIGFVAAAYTSGLLVEQGYGQRIGPAAWVCLCSTLALYIPGMLWLGFLTGPEVAFRNLTCWIPMLIAQYLLSTLALMGAGRLQKFLQSPS